MNVGVWLAIQQLWIDRAVGCKMLDDVVHKAERFAVAQVVCCVSWLEAVFGQEIGRYSYYNVGDVAEDTRRG